MKKRFPFVAAVSFSVFLPSNGSDHVKTLPILTLVAIGVCLGIALANLLALFNAESKDERKTGGLPNAA
jgi:hypothetical protein